MAKVRLITDDQLSWTSAARDEALDGDVRERLGSSERRIEYRIRERGSAQGLQLAELRYPPGTEVALHSHDHDEILFVLDGTMELGNRSVGKGASLFIAGGTFYAFRAGADGLHLLNFRPCFDASYNLPPERTGGG